MRLFHLLWLFILLLNSKSSLQQNEIKCTAPQIENGYVTDRNIQEYKERDVLLFECNDRYKRTEERATNCTRVGMRAEWTPTPACEPITCKVDLQSFEGTRYESVSKNVFLPGETLTVTCGEKYGISNNQPSAVTTCNEKGDWTIRPVCTEVICSNQRPQHVYSWENNWWHQSKMGETTRYRCVAGYVNAANRATCTRDGWTPNPLCRETTCDRLDHPEADVVSQYKQTYRYNEKVRFDCKDGYQGEFTLTCGEDGWHGNPKCTEITCNRKTLREADIVDNNKRKYRYNEQVGYRCKDGNQERFTLTCGEDGWIGRSPCTESVGCGSPPPLTDGDIKYTLKSNYSHKERVEFMCQSYFTMEGEPNRTCINGKWIGQMRCLKPCIVNEDVYKEHNITLKSNDRTFFTHDEMIEFKCARGIPVGAVAMRQRCNGGEILLPTCQ